MQGVERYNPEHLLCSGLFANIGDRLDERMYEHVQPHEEEFSPAREHCLVHLDEDVTNDQLPFRLYTLGVVPSFPYSLAVVGAKFPHFMEDVPIAATGFTFSERVFPGMRHCYVLRKENWGRLFSVCPADGVWLSHYRFLAYRNRRK